MALFFLLCAASAMVAFFYYPLGCVFIRGFWAPTSDPVWDPFFRHVIIFTYSQAVLSAALSAVVGTAGAFLYAGSEGWLRRWLGLLVLIPFSLPPILVVMGLLGIWGANGILGSGSFYGWTGILIAHTLFNFPIFVQTVGRALLESDFSEEKSALGLGLSRRRCFMELTWPKIRSAFWGAFLLAFLFCSSSFLIVLVLGGSPWFTTIEVAVYQAIKHDLDLGLAVRLALVQILVASIASLFVFQIPALGRSRAGGGFSLYAFRTTAAKCLVEGVYGCFVFVLLGLPLLWIWAHGLPFVFKSFDWAQPLLVSLQLLICVGVLSTFLAFCAQFGIKHLSGRFSGLVRWSCTLPISVSAVLILLGWRIAFPSWSASYLFLGVVCVQAIIALPVVYRPIEDGFSRLREENYRTARSLGASTWQVLRLVELPGLKGALGTAFLLGAAVSLGEAGSVLLFPSDSTRNLTYTIYQSMARYHFDEAYAGSAILLISTLLMVAGIAVLQREKIERA